MLCIVVDTLLKVPTLEMLYTVGNVRFVGEETFGIHCLEGMLCWRRNFRYTLLGSYASLEKKLFSAKLVISCVD